MKKLVVMLVMATSLVACSKQTPEQRIERQKQRVSSINAFNHACDVNGGIKDIISWRYYTEMQCNNGLSAKLDNE